MNIFVGNLSFEAKEIDVQRAFMAFGVVTSVAIVMEKKGKKSRGFGFVEMPDEQEALAAIAQLQDKELLGRPLNVTAAVSKGPKDAPADKISGQDRLLQRTGKYKEGRRTISFLKKRLDSGISGPLPEKRYKSNPMRWLKKPRTLARSERPEGDLKPWQRPQTESNPWKKPLKSGAWRKPEGQAKPWQKAAGEAKPWEKNRSGAKPWMKSDDRGARPWKKAEGVSRPWKRTEGAAKPWKKAEGEAKPWEKNRSESKSWIKSSSSEAKPWIKSSSSQARPWKKSVGEAKPWKRSASAAKPWRKSSADRQQSGIKKPRRFAKP